MLTDQQRQARKHLVAKLMGAATRLGTTIAMGSNLLGLASGIAVFLWTGSWWLVLRIFAALTAFVVVGSGWTHGALHLLNTIIWPRIERNFKRAVEENPELYGGDVEDERESWAIPSPTISNWRIMVAQLGWPVALIAGLGFLPAAFLFSWAMRLIFHGRSAASPPSGPQSPPQQLPDALPNHPRGGILR